MLGHRVILSYAREHNADNSYPILQLQGTISFLEKLQCIIPLVYQTIVRTLLGTRPLLANLLT